jgi:hypothetical protein
MWGYFREVLFALQALPESFKQAAAIAVLPQAGKDS